MTIKNPHIIHMREKAEYLSYLDRHWKYICCGSYTKEKSTENESNVTCKNCLRALNKIRMEVIK